VWEEPEGRVWAASVGRGVTAVIQTTVLEAPEASEGCPRELVEMEARERMVSAEVPDLSGRLIPNCSTCLQTGSPSAWQRDLTSA
jgi:hypothetical protein